MHSCRFWEYKICCSVNVQNCPALYACICFLHALSQHTVVKQVNLNAYIVLNIDLLVNTPAANQQHISSFYDNGQHVVEFNVTIKCYLFSSLMEAMVLHLPQDMEDLCQRKAAI